MEPDIFELLDHLKTEQDFLQYLIEDQGVFTSVYCRIALLRWQLKHSKDLKS